MFNNSYTVEKWCKEHPDRAKALGKVLFKNQFASSKKIREAVFQMGVGPEEESIAKWATENKSIAKQLFIKLYKELK